VHLSSHADETAPLAHWHINNQHYLESWSDARAYDGTVSIVQPMIDPLYGGHSAHEIFQALLDNPDVSAYEAVRGHLEASAFGEGRLRVQLAQGVARWLHRRHCIPAQECERQGLLCFTGYGYGERCA